jgi:hypothetical protein
MKLSYILIVAALAFAAGISAGQTSRPAGPVTLVDLPLKLPAVGNLGAVRQWRFGRIQSAERIGAQGDLILSIRTKDGTVLRMWIQFGKATPSRTEYVERMIAFDMDANQRLIAMISLEPVFRDRNRLRRALGSR